MVKFFHVKVGGKLGENGKCERNEKAEEKGIQLKKDKEGVEVDKRKLKTRKRGRKEKNKKIIIKRCERNRNRRAVVREDAGKEWKKRRNHLI